jgi:hypothetical protein
MTDNQRTANRTRPADPLVDARRAMEDATRDLLHALHQSPAWVAHGPHTVRAAWERLSAAEVAWAQQRAEAMRETTMMTGRRG